MQGNIQWNKQLNFVILMSLWLKILRGISISTTSLDLMINHWIMLDYLVLNMQQAIICGASDIISDTNTTYKTCMASFSNIREYFDSNSPHRHPEVHLHLSPVYSTGVLPGHWLVVSYNLKTLLQFGVLMKEITKWRQTVVCVLGSYGGDNKMKADCGLCLGFLWRR